MSASLGKFIDPCENTGQCGALIESNCQSLFQAHGFGPFGSVQAAFGYQSMQDCLADPRQIPLQCQPKNLQLYCQAAAALPPGTPARQDYASCLQAPAQQQLGAPFDYGQYNCMVNRNVQTAQDFQACAQRADLALAPPYMWPQVCDNRQ